MEEERRKRIDLAWASVFATSLSLAGLWFMITFNVGSYVGALLMIAGALVALINVTLLLTGSCRIEAGRAYLWFQVGLVAAGIALSAVIDAWQVLGAP